MKLATSSLLMVALMSLLVVQVMIPVYAAPDYTTRGFILMYIWNPKNDKAIPITINTISMELLDFDFYDGGGNPTASVYLTATKKNFYSSVLHNWGTDHWVISSDIEYPDYKDSYYHGAHGHKQLIIRVSIEDLGGYETLNFDITLLPPS